MTSKAAAAAALRLRLRSAAATLSGHVSGLSYLRKWLVLGAVLGVVAGLGAIVFYAALAFATNLFLGVLAGYQVPTPAAEGNLPGATYFARPWALPLVVGLGGLLSGILVFTLAPEAEGHGTDAAISAVHHNPRGVRFRAVVVKIVASAITLGSGGSGGREGPTAQISAGFGSFLARVLDLSPSDGRIAVSVGIGSGIGSIFGAPLGGALLSAEILYRDDIEVEAIVPGIIASIIGYTVFSSVYGFSPLFGFPAHAYQFRQPIQLVWFGLIGILGGLVGLLYAKGFYAISALFARARVTRIVKPAIGGLLVGILGLALPQVLGTGYGWIQKGLGPSLLGLPLWVVLALPFAKLLATSLSIGSGGSGGIFGPGMMIGAFLGAAVWRLLEPIAPGVTHDPAAFVIVGMMACFGSIARAPLAVMVMVMEMTGSFEVLAPAMVAVGIATLIVGQADDTIYRSQLRRRSDSAGSRVAAGLPLVGSIEVGRSMNPPILVLGGATPIGEARWQLAARHLAGAPVVDENAVFLGVVDAQAHAVAQADDATPVGSLADPTAPTTGVTAYLDAALESLMSSGRNWIPVLDTAKRVVGVLSTGDVVRSHRTALRESLRTSPSVAANTTMIDARLGERSALVGKPLRDAGLPPGTIVITLQRGSEVILPRGESVLEAGDNLSLLAPAHSSEQVRELVGADGPNGSAPASNGR